MKYRSEIDGLRARAVVPVILFHAGFSFFSGGFVGVDVFFVISGYLITTIIISDMEQAKFSLLEFYQRRARRILPALFFVVICCIPLAFFLLLPSGIKEFSKSLVAVATFSSNILFWRESGYFDTAAELKPLLHTWSLAVEEQFYILFPLFLMLAWRFGKQAIIWILVVSFIISLATAHWGAYNKPVATFYLLPTRAWELLIGAFAALYLSKRSIRTPKWLNNTLSVVGFAAILFSVIVFDNTTPFPSLYALAPTVGTVLIILFAMRGTMVHTLLSLRALVGVGLISYSLYLWHQPVFAFLRHYSIVDPTHTQILFALLASVLLAVFTYYVVETPFRRKTAFWNGSRILKGSSFVLIALVAVGVLGQFNNNFGVGKNIALDYQPDRVLLRSKSWELLRSLSQDTDYGAAYNDYDNLPWFDKDDDRYNVLIVGNSHSKDLFNVLFHSKIEQSKREIARYGAQIKELEKKFYNAPNYNNADVVVVTSKYDEDDLMSFEFLARRILKDRKILIIVPNIFEFYDVNGRTLVDVMVLRCIKRYNCDLTGLYREINTAFFDDLTDRRDEGRYFRSLETISRIRSIHPDVIIMDRMEYVCDEPEQKCFAVDARLNKYFYDYGHHTLEGAKFFADQVDKKGWLKPIFHALKTQEVQYKVE